MKVKELIKLLQEIKDQDAPVLFDTEAATYFQHMVDVDRAFFEEEPYPHVGLHTKDEAAREYGLATRLTLSDAVVTQVVHAWQTGSRIHEYRALMEALRAYAVKVMGAEAAKVIPPWEEKK